jgi:hypothetical protein
MMNTLRKYKNKILWGSALTLIISVTIYINWPHGKSYTDRLPAIDSVYLSRLLKTCGDCPFQVRSYDTITGQEAEKFAQLWRKVYFYNAPSECSENLDDYIYELKFYRQGKLMVQVRFGKRCENLEFVEPKIEKKVGFSRQGYRGVTFTDYVISKLS